MKSQFLYLLVSILSNLIGIYSWILVIYALLSWLPQVFNGKFGRWIRRIVEPYLSIFDKIPTRFGVFDFKVLIGLVCLLALKQFLVIIF